VESLQDKSILITGGGSGIGAGTAKYLLDRGAKVTICGRRANKVSAIADQLGTNCRGLIGDITQTDDRQEIVSGALEHGGGIDGLINNAGNMYRGPLVELSETKLKEVFDTNVISALLLCGLCAPHLARTQGSIVFLGSVHSRRAFPGVSPYAATKGAIEALTTSLAAELGVQQIRVNCVVPGAVFTEINQRAGLLDDKQALDRLQSMAPLHALQRIGEVHEVAQAIAYLLTAQWTTGAILRVDGGLALGLTKEQLQE
jgi:3-oxoacyl-[acyl-carrier protein] reductase